MSFEEAEETQGLEGVCGHENDVGLGRGGVFANRRVSCQADSVELAVSIHLKQQKQSLT